MKGWSIRTRVLFLALAPSVMILLSLVVYFTYQAIAQVDVSLAERGHLIARRLAEGTEYAIFVGDRAALQRMTDAAAGEVDVGGIAIDDALGQPLARSGANDAGAPLRFSEPIRQTRLAVADFPEDQAQPAQPAEPAKSIGNVTVTMSRLRAAQEQQRLLLTGLALGLFGLAFAITLALSIGGTVIEPIRRLAKAMRELGAGRRIAPIPTAGGGELTTLAQGFNRMAKSLAADAAELEARVVTATRALTAQKEAAEQATQAKSRFIAAASHDLRQPLHAIGLFTSALQRRARDDRELQATVADLGAAVANMERLFASLLDISRLDAGTLVAQPRAFPLARLFDQLAAEYADAAAEKGLRLRLHCAGAIVVSDEVLLHRIMSNLVANAIRYTPAGSVMVCCRRRGTAVCLEVRDSGVGIAPEKHADIFLEFYRIGDAHAERAMGLGLGLAIVARLAALLDTCVGVRSAPGRGSTFSLRVPRGEPFAVAAPADAPLGVLDAALRLRVLVVDDDPLVLAGNRALLEQFGCEVAAVSDGAAALAALQATDAGELLVLCDFWLANGESGVDLLRQLTRRTDKRVSGILVSGDTRPETERAASDAGFLLLHKPVAPARLRAAVMDAAARLRQASGVETR